MAAAIAIWVGLTAPAAPAQPTSATITASLSPDRASARGALTFTAQLTGGESGVPSPVQMTVVKFPAGLTLDIPTLRSCSRARLLARGPSGCPAQSKVGQGHALAEVLDGPQLITEDVLVWAFVGPPENNEPTLELVGEGSNPAPAQVVVTGIVRPARVPYGEELVIPIPPVPTLPFSANTSMASLSLTIGMKGRHPPRSANTVIAPPRCPAGGFPFAAEFTYADGSTSSPLARAPCVR
jgi:hypothetical protein